MAGVQQQSLPTRDAACTDPQLVDATTAATTAKGAGSVPLAHVAMESNTPAALAEPHQTRELCRSPASNSLTISCASDPSRRPRSPHCMSGWEMEVALVQDFLASYESDSLSSDQDDDDSSSSSDQGRLDTASSALAAAATTTRAAHAAALVRSAPMKLTFANSHARRKHEMATLRRQKDELSDLLARLQCTAHRTCATSCSTTASTAAIDSARLLRSQQLAEHVLTQRKRAERENLALRASALDHKRMAKTLQRILLKRVAKIKVMEERLRFVAPPSRTELALASDQAIVFMRLLQDVDAMCDRASGVLSVMAQLIPVDRASSYRKWFIEDDATTTLRLQVVHTNEVPFSKAAVDEVSRLLHEQAMRTCSVDPQVRNQRPDVRMLESRARYIAPHATGIYRVRLASRMFVRADRTLSVSAAYVNAADGGTPLPGEVLKDEQWCLLTERASVNPETGANETTTRVETISRIVPAHARPRYWDRATVERELIPAWDHVISFAHQAIENKLVDVMMAQQRARAVGAGPALRP